MAARVACFQVLHEDVRVRPALLGPGRHQRHVVAVVKQRVPVVPAACGAGPVNIMIEFALARGTNRRQLTTGGLGGSTCVHVDASQTSTRAKNTRAACNAPGAPHVEFSAVPPSEAFVEGNEFAMDRVLLEKCPVHVPVKMSARADSGVSTEPKPRTHARNQASSTRGARHARRRHAGRGCWAHVHVGCAFPERRQGGRCAVPHPACGARSRIT